MGEGGEKVGESGRMTCWCGEIAGRLHTCKRATASSRRSAALACRSCWSMLTSAWSDAFAWAGWSTKGAGSEASEHGGQRGRE